MLGVAFVTAKTPIEERGAWKMLAGAGLYEIMVGLVWVGLIGASEESTTSPMVIIVRSLTKLDTIIAASTDTCYSCSI
jgi:predicted acyltransferase